ncbi:MAG: polysaccharide biosynthesis protein, partial [Actinomycetota bacterium]|nr:polysaccharide biosynthesis protein [Actinomycetota bacterium]
TGSIGSALVEALRQLGAREIRVLARRARGGRASSSGASVVRFVEADIGEAGRLADAVEGIDVIFHLAALKDVAACEADPDAALRTNVIGSANLLMAALNEPGVHRLIAVSSDKACAPSSVLGMTKATMERAVAQMAREVTRSFGSVRFGNVWGASGSVLRRWQESARGERRIDVTDPKMTRFFLTQQQAIGHLVALASRPFAGEVVAPRMRAYRLGDLADVFAQETGAVVRIIGTRAGEKLHEDLVSKEEAPTARVDDDLIVIDGRRDGPGISPFTSADADMVSETELRELVRAS